MSQENDRELQARLRAAVRAETAPPDLAARIRARRDSPAPFWAFGWKALAAAGTMALVLGGFTGYQLGHFRYTDGAQESYIASISERLPGIMTVGLGDHVHCAIQRKAAKDTMAAEAYAESMGERFAGLAALVKDHVPAGFRIVEAHQCTHRGRPFAHIALRKDSKLVSVVIAAKADGETLAGLPSALAASGIPIYHAGAQGFQIAAFEAGEFLAWVVSDFDVAGNSRVTAALAGPVAGYLGRSRG